MSNDTNNWDKSAKLVMHELQQLTEGQKEIQKDLTIIKMEIARLQIKAGILGASAGALISGIALAIKALIGK